jgi:hypothetical protein
MMKVPLLVACVLLYVGQVTGAFCFGCFFAGAFGCDLLFGALATLFPFAMIVVDARTNICVVMCTDSVFELFRSLFVLDNFKEHSLRCTHLFSIVDTEKTG